MRTPSTPFRKAISRSLHQVIAIFLLIGTAAAQPYVQIGLFPSSQSGSLEVRLKSDGNFNELLSNMLFTISWPTASGAQLDNAQLVSLCDRVPIVPNGDGLKQSGGRSYQTYFMLSLQQLADACPLAPGQELTVMRIPVTGLSSCVDFKLTNDAYTAANNKNYYLSLNGQDRTGAIYNATAQVCSCTTIALDLATDGQPAETGWEFYNGNNQLLASGQIPANKTNTNVHLAACRNGGCYRVRITDSAGNGINSTGYTVKVGGEKVIDATGMFGSSSSLANNGTFCLPVGPTSLKPPYCDQTGVSTNDVLRAIKITGADSYTFWVFDPHGSFDTTIVRSGPNLKFTANLWNRIPHDLSLNVRVNARIGGVYGAFGKACTTQLGVPGMLALSVQEVEEDGNNGLSVYPNPVQDGTFHVRYAGEGEQHAVIGLFSATGQCLLSKDVSFTDDLDLPMQLPAGTASGIYMLSFTTAQGRMMRMVVQP